MVKNCPTDSPTTLDLAFTALADPRRRRILERLGDGAAPLSTVVEPLDMSLPGGMKHVRTLERAGLISTHKQGRVRWCRLSPQPLDEVSTWIEEHRRLWDHLLDRFEQHIEATKGSPPA